MSFEHMTIEFVGGPWDGRVMAVPPGTREWVVPVMHMPPIMNFDPIPDEKPEIEKIRYVHSGKADVDPTERRVVHLFELETR